jgi:membrane protease YdiL (CAAX protease family)
MHLIPGVIITALYIAFMPIVKLFDYPTILALFLGVLFGITFQLGYVLYTAKKKTGSYSLKGALTAYTHRSPVWQYIILSIVYVAWCVLCFLILPKLYGQAVMDHLFSWIPEWFIPSEGSNLSMTAIIVIVVAGFLSNIGGAIVEELYFRGVLLPKVSWMGSWAMLFTTVLFTVYHFDSPWQFIERFLSMLPLVIYAWRKKDFLAALIPHCALNAVSIVLMTMELMG